MGQTTQSVAVWRTDWVDLGAGLMVLQVSSWLHAASARPKRFGPAEFELEAATALCLRQRNATGRGPNR